MGGKHLTKLWLYKKQTYSIKCSTYYDDNSSVYTYISTNPCWVINKIETCCICASSCCIFETAKIYPAMWSLLLNLQSLYFPYPFYSASLLFLSLELFLRLMFFVTHSLPFFFVLTHPPLSVFHVSPNSLCLSLSLSLFVCLSLSLSQNLLRYTDNELILLNGKHHCDNIGCVCCCVLYWTCAIYIKLANQELGADCYSN